MSDGCSRLSPHYVCHSSCPLFRTRKLKAKRILNETQVNETRKKGAGSDGAESDVSRFSWRGCNTNYTTSSRFNSQGSFLVFHDFFPW